MYRSALSDALLPKFKLASQGLLVPRENKKFITFLKRAGIWSKWVLVDNFLSDLATDVPAQDQEDKIYRMTNALSELVFDAPNVDALIYPSVGASFKWLNICMKSAIADKTLVPAEAWVISIDGILDHVPGLKRVGDQVLHQVSFVRRSAGIDPDGNIHWSDILHGVKPEDIEHLTWQPQKESIEYIASLHRACFS